VRTDADQQEDRTVTKANSTQATEELMALEAEIHACGGAYAELIFPGTEEFERIDAITMARQPRPHCLACKDIPDVPAAFVSIYACEGETTCLPIPICVTCARRKDTEQLQAAVRKLVETWAPGATIQFVRAIDRADLVARLRKNGFDVV
jgi:hypothetical protein